MAKKVHEATNFAFVQLTDQEPGLYEKEPPTLCPEGQSGFGMGNNFTRHKGAWNFLIKTSQIHKRELTN